MFDTLLITYVGIDFLEQGNTAAVRSRYMQAGECHKFQKSCCLQGDCLSAGVRTCDDEKVKLFSQADIDRNDFFLVNQRVPCLSQIDNAVCVDDRLCAVHRECERGACKYKVELCHDFIVVSDLPAVFGEHFGEFCENDLDFLLLFDLQLTDVVVQLYYRSRFYEYRVARRAHVMDYAGDICTVFRLDRNAVSSVSCCDQGVLKIVFRVGCDDAVQLRMDPFARCLDISSDLTQLR